MIDIFTILLSHSLIVLAGWRLLFRDDLDCDDPEAEKPRRPWLNEEMAREAAPDA